MKSYLQRKIDGIKGSYSENEFLAHVHFIQKKKVFKAQLKCTVRPNFLPVIETARVIENA